MPRKEPLRVNQICRRVSEDNHVASSFALRDDDKLVVQTIDGPRELGVGWFIVNAVELVPTVPLAHIKPARDTET